MTFFLQKTSLDCTPISGSPFSESGSFFFSASFLERDREGDWLVNPKLKRCRKPRGCKSLSTVTRRLPSGHHRHRPRRTAQVPSTARCSRCPPTPSAKKKKKKKKEKKKGARFARPISLVPSRCCSLHLTLSVTLHPLPLPFSGRFLLHPWRWRRSGGMRRRRPSRRTLG